MKKTRLHKYRPTEQGYRREPMKWHAFRKQVKEAVEARAAAAFHQTLVLSGGDTVLALAAEVSVLNEGAKLTDWSAWTPTTDESE